MGGWGYLVPVGNVRIVFLVFYPETGQGGAVSGEGEDAKMGNVFGKINHC